MTRALISFYNRESLDRQRSTRELFGTLDYEIEWLRLKAAATPNLLHHHSFSRQRRDRERKIMKLLKPRSEFSVNIWLSIIEQTLTSKTNGKVFRELQSVCEHWNRKQEKKKICLDTFFICFNIFASMATERETIQSISLSTQNEWSNSFRLTATNCNLKLPNYKF